MQFIGHGMLVDNPLILAFLSQLLILLHVHPDQAAAFEDLLEVALERQESCGITRNVQRCVQEHVDSATLDEIGAVDGSALVLAHAMPYERVAAADHSQSG